MNKSYLSIAAAALMLFGWRAGEVKRVAGDPSCRAIRRLGHPFTKRADLFREVRYALLDTCPDTRLPVARATVEVNAGGAKRMREFEVVRFFANRQEAERHAREHGVADFKTEVDDYGVLPPLRPVVSYLKALEADDFALYRTAFDAEWKPRHLTHPNFWDDIRRRHTERLKKALGDDYTPADLDFRFVSLDRSKPAGEVDVTYRGRTLRKLMSVVFIEEEGVWKIDSINH